MNKTIITAIAIILLPLAIADTINNQAETITENPLGITTTTNNNEQPTANSTLIPTGGNTNIYYDVIITVKDKTINPGKTIKATITITNQGDKSDRDTILEYYLVKDNKIYDYKKEQLKEIPPGTTTYEITRKAPTNQTGEMQIIAKYTTTVQPQIIAADTFTIKEQQNNKYILAIIITTIIITTIILLVVRK